MAGTYPAHSAFKTLSFGLISEMWEIRPFPCQQGTIPRNIFHALSRPQFHKIWRSRLPFDFSVLKSNSLSHNKLTENGEINLVKLTFSWSSILWVVMSEFWWRNGSSPVFEKLVVECGLSQNRICNNTLWNILQRNSDVNLQCHGKKKKIK